jgi:hypothetical protein
MPKISNLDKPEIWGRNMRTKSREFWDMLKWPPGIRTRVISAEKMMILPTNILAQQPQIGNRTSISYLFKEMHCL